mmetsp:Transcript_58768/g.108471  ORF Transcript_58768/g.108471 Transcript_58768/m.108471 type:complete len:698 (+) Transcript_58768:76-2169(+)
MAALGYDVRIVSCQLGLPTTYDIQVRFGHEQKTVVRRYTDFYQLAEGLDPPLARHLPDLPPKLGAKMVSKDCRDARKEGLQRYLAALVRADPGLECERWAAFLEVSDMQRDRVRQAWWRHLQQARGSPAQPVGFGGHAPASSAAAASALTAGAFREIWETHATYNPPQVERSAMEATPGFAFEVPTPPESPDLRSACRPVVEDHAGLGSAAQGTTEDETPETVLTPAAPAGMEDIREIRRQQWLRRQQASSSPPQNVPAQNAPPQNAPAQSSGAAPRGSDVAQPGSSPRPTPSASSSAVGEPAEELSRLQLLPLYALPEEYSDGRERQALLSDTLNECRNRGTVLEAGMILTGSGGHAFAVMKCLPASGVITDATVLYTEGPVVPRFVRVQFVHIKGRSGQRAARLTENNLMADYLIPYFRSLFSEPHRCAVVSIGDTLDIFGQFFHVQAVDPCGCGILDESTLLYTHLDDAEEFDRIHVVPFSDTLPAAYNFDVFHDYVRPFFATHVLERFQVGQTFYFNSVQFKVVAAEPQDVCRVGTSTEIFCEGVLHPTAANLLSPEQAQRLAVLPPPVQMLFLNSDIIGDSSVAERIINAQQRQSQLRNAAHIRNMIDHTTEAHQFHPDLLAELGTDQSDCVVCLGEFQEGDSIRVLRCRHVFHSQCVDEWLSRETHCPLCRESLVPQSHRMSRSRRRVSSG